MYSLVLMTVMAAGPDAPASHGNKHQGNSGSCNGCGGSCNGCNGVLFPRIRAFFSFGSCSGCCGSCNGCCGSCGGCGGSNYSCSGCFGTAYSCYGCSGGVAYASCQGGMGYPGYPTIPDAGVPMYDRAPYVPGAIPPVGSPGTGVPLAPNSPAPPAVSDDRYAYRPAAAGGGSRATVVVRLPVDAKLYANGQLLGLTSAERTFVTPELPAGREYTYTFKIEYDRQGETVSQSRAVKVTPGGRTPVDFADLVIGKAKLPGPDAVAKPVPPPADAERPNPFKAPAVPTSAERAKITVKLPPGATLYIDEKKNDRTDAVREFTTPPLPPGKEFAYKMTVEVLRNGLPERVTERVPFRAGETVTRDFATLLTGR